MVVNDLHVSGSLLGPSKADPVLVVDSYAVLAPPVPLQGFQPVPSRDPQVFENLRVIDGNKRIGFIIADIFLILNGVEIEAPEPQVVDIILGVADGSLDETGFATWIRSVSVPCRP